MIYVLGALWVRRSADLGVGVWRATFVANALSALFFSPLLLLGGPGQPLSLLWQPSALAALLVTGQLLGFVALTRGDVTVATPVLGLKTVIVASLTALILADAIPRRVWFAAVLSSSAIALLSVGHGGRHRRVAMSLIAGGSAAVVFALFDVLVQKWSPQWGAGRLVPLVMAFSGVFSLSFVPMFNAPLSQIPRPALKPLLTGACCVAIQGIMLIMTIAAFGDVTAVNIVYATRSLWTVLIVWIAGHWFHNAEQRLGANVLTWRLIGAALMTAAVVLAVF
jgi:drug/metabolite transporter (DMT)-like permease